MENFNFHVTTDIRFGKDRLGELPEVLNQFGKRVLIVYGGGSIKKIGLYDQVMEQLKANDNEVFELAGVEPNPRIETVRRGAEICRKENVGDLSSRWWFHDRLCKGCSSGNEI